MKLHKFVITEFVFIECYKNLSRIMLGKWPNYKLSEDLCYLNSSTKHILWYKNIFWRIDSNWKWYGRLLVSCSANLDSRNFLWTTGNYTKKCSAMLKLLYKVYINSLKSPSKEMYKILLTFDQVCMNADWKDSYILYLSRQEKI